MHHAQTLAERISRYFFTISNKKEANLLAKIVHFTGFGSSIILILRGGIPRFMEDFPESLIQTMLVGTMLVGGLGVCYDFRQKYVCETNTPKL